MVMPVYDVLRALYTFACPAREHTSIPLSSFREVERLPGAAHPAVFRVRFACACGDEHDGLVAHDDLDWAPLGVGEERTFHNLMTARRQRVGEELGRSRLPPDSCGILAVGAVLLPGGTASSCVPVALPAPGAEGGSRAASASP